MKVGLQIFRFDWPGTPGRTGSHLAAIGRTADAYGFASLWAMDHFFQMDFPNMGIGPQDPMFDGYSVLNYLAAVTGQVQLGTLVTGVTYRQPGHLIKTVTGLDVLSGGRAILGIGAAWYERESLGLGFPFPPLKERFERLEETLQIAKQMWQDDQSPYKGTHYQLAEPINHPQPLSRPHPPIMIGGGGEKKTLRLVAQYGDACNLFGMLPADQLRHKLDVLKGHCDDVGRDYAEIEKTVLGSVMPDTTPAQLIATCKSLADLGFEHFIFNMAAYDLAQIEQIGREVIPEVAGF